jgi:hypothetical protein
VIDEVAADARRVARLADDLLALSREEAAGTPTETVRIDELAHEAAGGRVRAEAPEPVLVRGDRAALERALANLVQNAELYGHGQIEVTAAQENGLARLTVADEGPGLSFVDAEKAFGRFWRGGEAKPGSGLGLAIVRATAERHGGRAFARGARFTIELPALRDVSENAATTDLRPEKGSREAAAHRSDLAARPLAALVVAVGVGRAAIACRRGGRPEPPAKPLPTRSTTRSRPRARRRHGAHQVHEPALPVGRARRPVGSALMSGASGRLWATNDGRGRLELQSDAGDVQVVWNRTAVRCSTPRRTRSTARRSRSTPAAERPRTGRARRRQIDAFLSTGSRAREVSGARPTDVAGQAAYSVRVSPKHDGGLLGRGRARLAPRPAVPLRVGDLRPGQPRAGARARGHAHLVRTRSCERRRRLAAREGEGDRPRLRAAPAARAREGTRPGRAATRRPGRAVPAVAPDTLVGLPRRTSASSAATRALVAVYGTGSAGSLVVERSRHSGGRWRARALPDGLARRRHGARARDAARHGR